jgi:hypothetical protein
MDRTPCPGLLILSFAAGLAHTAAWRVLTSMSAIVLRRHLAEKLSLGRKEEKRFSERLYLENTVAPTVGQNPPAILSGVQKIMPYLFLFSLNQYNSDSKPIPTGL